MTRGALKLRLLAAGAVSILLALAVSGIGLQLLFERHVERRIAIELESDLRQLIGAIEPKPDGALQLSRPLAEPRFSEPLSGIYWQVSSQPNGAALRSRSLWDTALDLPEDALGDGAVHRHVLAGPNGTSLFAVERAVVLPKALGGARVRAVVAIDRAELTVAGRAFGYDLLPYLGLLAAVLMAAAWVQVTVGLKPLDTVRRRLAEIRSGDRARLGAGFPDEVRPLANEVDLLLAGQEEAIARARARAADLAHALRTPLTVLQGDAEALRSRGETVVADEIVAITQSMRRFVERELARSRAGARVLVGRAQPLRPVIAQIVGVLHRLPAGSRIDFEIDVADDLRVDMDPQDLTEILGSLGDNAAKWARGRVLFGARDDTHALTLVVEDDGPGIPASEVATVLKRGGRLPQAQPGSGLGLSIVADLAEAYGGTISLSVSSLGGLRVGITLPKRQGHAMVRDGSV